MAQDFLSALAAAGSQPATSDFLAALAKAPPPAQSPPNGGAQPQEADTWTNAAKNVGSAIVRPLAKGVAALPLMAMDAGVAGRNLAGDAANRVLGRPATPDYTLPSAMFNDALDSVTRKPSGIGKGAEFVSTLLAGGKVPGPTTASAVPSNFAGDLSKMMPGAALRSLAARSAPAAPFSVPSALTGAQADAAAGGRALGMKLTPGQASGSKPLQQIETWAQSHPWTSAPFARLARGNQDALNQTAARSIGEDSPTVDANTLSDAASRTGDVFNAVRNSDVSLPANPEETNAFIKQLDEENAGLLPGNASVSDHPLVKTLQGLMNGDKGEPGTALVPDGTPPAAPQVTAKQLGQLSSKLGRAAYKQMTSQGGDRDLGQALNAVKSHVDDLLESNLTGEGKDAYSQARSQYRSLMQLTSRGNIVNPSTGNVNGVALASRLQQSDRPGFLFGRNTSPLYQAARFAQAFKPIVGDSGTATRMGNPFDPLELAVGLPANLAARAYLTRPGGAIARGAIGGVQAARHFAPLALKSLLMNPAFAGAIAGQ